VACRIVATTVLAGMMLACAANLKAEWQERVAEHDDRVSLLPQKATSKALPPRASLIYAVIAGRLALRAISPYERQRLVKVAEGYAAEASAARPNWAEACVTQLFIGYVMQDSNEITKGSIERSYRCTRFANDAAAWRLHYAATKWPILDEAVRDQVIDEAVWLAHGSRPDQNHRVKLLLKISPDAYARYNAAKWLQTDQAAS